MSDAAHGDSRIDDAPVEETRERFRYWLTIPTRWIDYVGADEFTAGEFVDVTGTSKGRGFTGVMKRHNFKGTKASHGVHEFFRHGGSIGMSAYPARVFKGKRMAGQHGNARVTMQNLKVHAVIEDQNLVLVRGGVPGPNGGIVMIRSAVKKQRQFFG